MAEPEVVNVVRKYREGLAENERDMLRRMARLWVEPYRYFEKQVNALADEISKRRESGQPVYPDYVYSLERYKSMMEQAQKRIDQYNRSVLGIVTGEETEAAEIGHESAKEPVNLAEPDAPMWTRVNQREARIAAGMTADGSPLERLLAKSYDLTRERLEQTLVTGLAVGQGSGYIARQLMDAFEMPEQRALLIARTEVNRAYRLANWETMKSSKAVKGYRRMCYPPTACFACLVLDGEFYPLNSAPCDHPNGKCSFVPVTEHYDPIDAKNWKRGRDWLMEQDEATQRKIMGAGRFALWKDQGIDPRDMVYIKENPIWGGSPTVKTLEELRKAVPNYYRKDVIVEPTKIEYPEILDRNRTISIVVEKFNIHLRGSGKPVKVIYDDTIKADYGMTNTEKPDEIRVGYMAFASEEELARTIAHELVHSRELLKTGKTDEVRSYDSDRKLHEYIAGLR